MRGKFVAVFSLVTVVSATASADTASPLCNSGEDSFACLSRLVRERCQRATIKIGCEAVEAAKLLPLVMKWFEEKAKAAVNATKNAVASAASRAREAAGHLVAKIMGDTSKTSDPAWTGQYCTKDAYFSRAKLDLSYDGVANFGVVAPGKLMRGSQPFIDGQANPAGKKGNGFDALKNLGVKCRVLLRTTTITDNMLDERNELKKRGIKLFHFPVPSLAFGPPADSILGVKIPDSARAAYTRALETARDGFMKVMDNPANGLCYLSCQSGKDRTGTLIGWYRAVKQGWKPARIFQEQDDCKFTPQGYFMYYRRTFCRWYRAKFGADRDCDRVLASGQ